MIFEPFTMLAALIPFIGRTINKIVDYKTGGPAPSNAQEAIELKKADTEQLRAVGALDNADGASQWVINVRALQRPIAVFAILGVWSVIVIASGAVALQLVCDLASSAIFYLFGDRTSMSISKRIK